MKKDEVWNALKNDGSKAYGEPMLDAFLRVTQSIERRHLDELPKDKKKLVSAQCLLDVSISPEEAEEAIAKGNTDLNQALKNAARRGDIPMMDFFIGKGAINLKTALAAASKSGSLESVQYLIGKGAEPTNQIVMDNAAEMGHLEILKYLDKISGNKKKLDGPLWWAAHGGKLEVVKYIMGLRNRLESEFDLALNVAAEKGQNEVVEFLMDARPESTGEALKRALQRGHLETLDIMVDKGADPTEAILYAVETIAKSGFVSIRIALDRILDRSHKVERIAWNLARDYPDIKKYMDERKDR